MQTNQCLFIYGVLLVAMMSLEINSSQEVEQGELQLKEGDFSITVNIFLSSFLLLSLLLRVNVTYVAFK